MSAEPKSVDQLMHEHTSLALDLIAKANERALQERFQRFKDEDREEAKIEEYQRRQRELDRW